MPSDREARYKAAMAQYADALRRRRERIAQETSDEKREYIKQATEKDLKIGESAAKGAQYGTAVSPGWGTAIGAWIGTALGTGKAIAARKKRGRSTWDAIKRTGKDFLPWTGGFYKNFLPSMESAGGGIMNLAKSGWGAGSESTQPMNRDFQLSEPQMDYRQRQKQRPSLLAERLAMDKSYGNYGRDYTGQDFRLKRGVK